MDNTPKGRLVRYEVARRNHLGYAVNLILTLAIASLGFSFALIKDNNFTPGCWSKSFLQLSLVSLGCSAGLGIWCVMNRLRDFKMTADIVREERKLMKNGKDEKEIGQLMRATKEEADKVGENTWALFWWQVRLFGAGVLFLIISFTIAYRTKVF